MIYTFALLIICFSRCKFLATRFNTSLASPSSSICESLPRKQQGTFPLIYTRFKDHCPAAILHPITTMESKNTKKQMRSMMRASCRHSEMTVREPSWLTILSLLSFPAADVVDSRWRKRILGVSSMTQSPVTNRTRPRKPTTTFWGKTMGH